MDQVSGSGPYGIYVPLANISHTRTRAVTDGCWTYVSTHRSLALHWHVQQQTDAIPGEIMVHRRSYFADKRNEWPSSKVPKLHPRV